MNYDNWPRIICLGSWGDIGVGDEEVIPFLDYADEQRYSLSKSILKKELILFNEAMSLQIAALSFASKNSDEWSAQDKAEIALMARVFNLIRAKSKLILFGYLGECPPINRAIHECVSRVLLFHWYPEEAGKFLKGKYQKQEYVDKKISVKLSSEISETTEIERELRQFYSLETKRVHPYPESVEFQTYGTHKDIGSRATLGGVGDAQLAPIVFTVLLHDCLLAAKTLGIIGLHQASEDWIARYTALEEKVFELLALHRNKPGKIFSND